MTFRYSQKWQETDNFFWLKEIFCSYCCLLRNFQYFYRANCLKIGVFSELVIIIIIITLFSECDKNTDKCYLKEAFNNKHDIQSNTNKDMPNLDLFSEKLKEFWHLQLSAKFTFLLHLSQWYALAPSNKSPFTYCSSDSRRLWWLRISTFRDVKGSSLWYLV